MAPWASTEDLLVKVYGQYTKETDLMSPEKGEAPKKLVVVGRDASNGPGLAQGLFQGLVHQRSTR